MAQRTGAPLAGAEMAVLVRDQGALPVYGEDGALLVPVTFEHAAGPRNNRFAPLVDGDEDVGDLDGDAEADLAAEEDHGHLDVPAEEFLGLRAFVVASTRRVLLIARLLLHTAAVTTVRAVEHFAAAPVFRGVAAFVPEVREFAYAAAAAAALLAARTADNATGPGNNGHAGEDRRWWSRAARLLLHSAAFTVVRAVVFIEGAPVYHGVALVVPGLREIARAAAAAAALVAERTAD